MPVDTPSCLELRREGRRDEALAALGERLRAEPKDAAARAILGEVLRESGARRRGYDEIRRSLALDPQARYAETYLKDAGRFEAWAFGCRGGARRAQGRLDEACADLARAVALDAGCGWAWGWLGEAELGRERLDAALAALDRAVGLFPEWPEAFGWRGEVLRRLGRVEAALRDLDHAVALGHRDSTVFLSRAAARQARGDADGHMADLEAAVRAHPESFRAQAKRGAARDAARWIEGVLARSEKAKAQAAKAAAALDRGDASKAQALLERALALDPGLGEAHRLLADALRRLERPDDAVARADAAVRHDPCSDSYAKRAELAQAYGYNESALRDLSLAVALGPSARLYQWRARAFLGMRHYDLALRDITAALALEPQNPALYELRAHVNLLLARLAEAQSDIEKALSTQPRHVNLHLRLGQLLALRSWFDEARASVAPIEKSAPAWAHFIRGYVLCVEKRYAEAGEQFRKAGALAEARDGRLGLEAGFYGTVARAFGALGKGETVKSEKGGPEKKGKVYLCGLGVYPPQTATVEVLRGISECDVVFNNLPGLGISEFLGLFCANRRPVAFRYEQDAKLCADLVLSEVRPGRTVGFVTFGHPLLFGPLSHEIIKRCAKEGIPCKAFGAVSSMDAVLAASGQVLGYSYGGFQMFETTGAGILKEIPAANPNLPIVIYFAEGLGDQGLAALIKTLGKLYSPRHRCLLYGPKHELWETAQEGVTLAGLAKISHHKLAQNILFVPPRNGKKA